MDRTIIEDRAERGESRDSFSLSCDGTSAGIAGVVDGQDCTLGLSQGHAGVNLILAHQRHESTWCETGCKDSSAVAACLIEPHCSVDAYPNRLPDSLPVLRISINQTWKSMKDLSMTTVASRLLNGDRGRKSIPLS
jgi:hypothetical protein